MFVVLGASIVLVANVSSTGVVIHGSAQQTSRNENGSGGDSGMDGNRLISWREVAK
jgi:hypothetical protein